jgi:hypothetical protein
MAGRRCIHAIPASVLQEERERRSSPRIGALNQFLRPVEIIQAPAQVTPDFFGQQRGYLLWR